ncbi:MAG: hypothetical protein HUJ78_04625, partial [Mogibacterium sp.]|nr:hypothetical protein [Mogibacterium sp.]
MNEELEMKQQQRQRVLRIGLFVIMDIFIVIISAIMPMILRFGIFTIDIVYFNLAMKWLPLDIVIAIAVLAFFKLYNRVWSYASIEELFDVFKASVVIEAIYIAYKLILGIEMMRSYYPFNWFCLFLLLAGSRISVRILKRILHRFNRRGEKKRIMIIGGGSAGSLLINELKSGLGNNVPVCVIDDNKAKKNKVIHGVPIVGSREDIAKNVDRYGIDEIIMALPSASPTDTRDILKLCQESGAKVKLL